MYSANNRLRIIKHMKLEPFIDAYYKAKMEAESDIALHLRIATSGHIDRANCHPFVYGNMGLMHNGILPIKVPPNSPINDTQLFVKHFMGSKLSTDVTLLKRVANMIGKYNKFVIMDNNGLVRIVNKSSGFSIEGDWFSNLNFLI